MATSTTIHLDGPEVWHVMLHHHRDQRAIALHIQEYLQRWKLKCCLVDVNSDKQSTENYCWRSRVIIPIISKDYITRSVETGSWAIIQDKLEVGMTSSATTGTSVYIQYKLEVSPYPAKLTFDLHRDPHF